MRRARFVAPHPTRRWLIIAAAALFAVFAPAQSPAPASASDAPLAAALEHLSDAAGEMARSLPSFACLETGLIQERHGRSVKHHTAFTASVRAVRSAGGLAESMQLLSINNKPATGDRFNLPFYVEGGFDQALRYFAPSHQPCFRFAVSPFADGQRVDFHYNPASPASCEESAGVTGFALLDAAGNVTHVERNVDPELATNPRLTAFAAIDFAPVTLNGRTFRLSQHLLSETPRGRLTERFEVSYSACRLFTASIRIGPASALPAGTDRPPASPSPQ